METLEPTFPGTSATPTAPRGVLTSRGPVIELASGAASTYAFGLAVAASHSSVESLADAAGLAALPLAFTLFYAPSLWVLLTLFHREVAPSEIARAATRCAERGGLFLLGLVPATVFFEWTSAGPSGLRITTFLESAAVLFAGIIGLRAFGTTVLESTRLGTSDRVVLGLVAAASCVGMLLGVLLVPDTLARLHGGGR